MAAAKKSAAVFLDRDGTIVRDVDYLRCLRQLEVLPGVPEAIRLLRRSGLKVIVVTNQSGVARGLFSEKELRTIHQELQRRLAEENARLDAVYYCPHHPTEGREPYRILCGCRKPSTGLVWQACDEFSLDRARSYLVGDQTVDMELAARIGARGVWIDSGRGRPAGSVPPMHEARNLLETACWIAGDLKRRGEGSFQ